MSEIFWEKIGYFRILKKKPIMYSRFDFSDIIDYFPQHFRIMRFYFFVNFANKIL